MKLSLAQFQPVLLNKEENLKSMYRYIKEASAKNCDIILFPELALTGYFTRENTLEMAEDLHGESISRLKGWAKQYNIMIAAGFPEKKDGRIYNSAVLIDRHGEVLGTYQKVHLWDEENKYFTPGDNFPVWKTELGMIGIMICYDTEFPETARTLARKGAEIILAPTANMTPLEHSQKIYIQSRALENQIFVATANRIGIEEQTHFFGESAASSPFGELLIFGDGEEGQYYTDIDLNQIKEARAAFYYLNDRRDSRLYQLEGREEPSAK
ncbi:carbon-nitrogen hydrolase family protein [Bacillus massiliglaciei]|uniref:carbon-nitrogen hydrolase family protein n=1 Tax=Bacillus massiliglaciei TaxID=1816693 RepID=UPI000DA60DB7|nr:carbon-nitrogen hydrolase family protein [Bacillus massiliglaciei]